MKSYFYQISEENIETILKYYETTNEKIKKYYKKIIKYIKYTNEYCSKIDILFNNEENNKNNINISSTDYEEIEIDYGIKNKEIKNKVSYDEILLKKINISPILNCLRKINKFFHEYTQFFKLFIKTLNIQLENLNKHIESTNNKINSIKNDHIIHQKNFISKHSELDELNKNLKKTFEKTEAKLINYCLDKKNKKKKKQELEDKLNAYLLIAVQTEKETIKKYNSLKNFGKTFNDSTNKKITTIKNDTSSLFQEFYSLIIYLFTFFNKCFIIPMEQIIDENKVFDEIKLKKEEFYNILSSYVKKIDVIKINNDLNIYDLETLKILEKNNLEETNEEEKIKEKNFFESFNINKENIEEEDIYYVLKNMYDRFILVNKNMSILENQRKKIEIKKIINKLTSFGEEKRKKSLNEDWNLVVNQKIETKENNNKKIENIKDEKEENKNINIINDIKDKNDINFITIKTEEKGIKKQEVEYLISLMNDSVYQRYFLLKINNYRTLGIFEMPLEIFNYIKEIFTAILNNLILKNDDEDEEENFINEQIENAKLIIILSQTFYNIKDKEKIYIQKEIKNEKIFQSNEFWKLIIKSSIQSQMKNLDEFINNNIENEEFIKERKKSIAFAQILPYVDTMKGFGVKDDQNKIIISPLIDEYEISGENKELIFNLLKS